MCGIAGVLLAASPSDPRELNAVRRMADLLAHRGPDGCGVWMDQDAGIALSHRRLAIVDLSEAGSQPMASHSGRYVATYNGEIYNFGDLRRDLEAAGCNFNGGSDTEVMLSAFERLGIERSLGRFAGMFACGIWDRADRVLHLIRDRMGKKPLYIGLVGRTLAFASELKAFRAVPGFKAEICPEAVEAMLRLGWVPNHHCIWKNVFKLPPGSILSVTARDIADADIDALRAKVRPWWSLREAAKAAAEPLSNLTETEMADELDRLLRLAVRERMVADVPLGAFLSGGIDSSVVVTLMQEQSRQPVRTFTIGFGEAGYDEATEAAQIARHLGTDHREFRLSPAAAAEIIPDLPRIWDEPFADESQIPTLLVSRLARQHVTVVLSGDGGDEGFGGYSRHILASRLAPALRLPKLVRRAVAGATLGLSQDTWNRIIQRAPLSRSLRRELRGDVLHKIARVLDSADVLEIYRRVITLDPDLASRTYRETPDMPHFADPVSQMSYLDMAGYLPDDILVKLDRATMSIGLEGRCPLLDHRVIEFAWRVPASVKVRGGKGKWLLRQVLGRYIPKEYHDRPKQGFNVPVGAWLRGSLRDWAEDLLSERRLRHEGLLDVGYVRGCWMEHQAKRRDRSKELWAILMFQAWADQAKRMELPTEADGYATAPLGE